MRARRILAAALLAGLTLAPRCSVPSKRPAARQNLSAAPTATASPAPDAVASTQSSATQAPDLFRETIRPILSARCGHCHDPGGRMYARLPFDDPGVVSSHAAGVLRRLKGDDRAAMEKWLAGLASAGAER